MTPDWEVYLTNTAAKIVDEQSPKCLLEVRERIYELLTHCIPPEAIFKVCLDKICLFVAALRKHKHEQ